MDSLIPWIIGFTALGGVLSVFAAAAFLLVPEETRARMLSPMVSFAIGALLGASFLAILPHAFETPGVGAHQVTLTVLCGILVFFLLEKMVIWRHCHTHDCDVHGDTSAHMLDVDRARHAATGNLILIGDGIHNMVDGVLIAAAFLTDVHLGVITSIAVIAHEIPQELGDFAILLHSGYSRSRALLYNALTGLTTIIGGVMAYFSLSLANQLVPYVLAIAASSFIYIAVADLIPGLHKRPEFSATVQQIVLIVLGVGVIFVAHSTLH
ncbi:MAG: ZIP zinc transporter [Candidatus Muproteobacteria bacterium RIFCSPHIGHO2_01_FULL_61_200]|nr:MAG: ZIP zinc transporter [Candidatus Muproteobacteria bacterium RIFCSPHIGHO2_01_FULL_61_200]